MQYNDETFFFQNVKVIHLFLIIEIGTYKYLTNIHKHLDVTEYLSKEKHYAIFANFTWDAI